MCACFVCVCQAPFYYTMSAIGLVYIDKGEPSDPIPLGDWITEQKSFSLLRKHYKFFSQYVQRGYIALINTILISTKIYFKLAHYEATVRIAIRTVASSSFEMACEEILNFA